MGPESIASNVDKGRSRLPRCVMRALGGTCLLALSSGYGCMEAGKIGDTAAQWGSAVQDGDTGRGSQRVSPFGPCKSWGVLEVPRVGLAEAWVDRRTGRGEASFGGTTGPYPDGAVTNYGVGFYWEDGYYYGGNGWTWRCEADGVYLVDEYSSRGVTSGLDTYTYTPMAPILIFLWSAVIGDHWQVRSPVRMDVEILDDFGHYSYRHDMEGTALNFLVEDQHGIVVNGRPTHALILRMEGVGTWMPFYGARRLWIVEGLGLVRAEDPESSEVLEIVPWG